MDGAILTWAWCLLGVNKKKSVGLAYTIHAIQRNSVEVAFSHLGRHANAQAAQALLGAGPDSEPVTLPRSLWPSVILRLSV